MPSSFVDPVSPLVAESLLNSEPAAHVDVPMVWHAEASEADLNWPAGHKVHVPSSAVDPVSPLVAEWLLKPEPAAHAEVPVVFSVVFQHTGFASDLLLPQPSVLHVLKRM